MVSSLQIYHNVFYENKNYVRFRYAYHAEEDCIRKCKKKNIKLSQCKMYILRVGDGVCKPCVKCQKILNKYKISKVFCMNKHKSKFT